MNEINIITAQYTLDIEGNKSSIKVNINGIKMSVPLDLTNRHYSEIMKQVEAGTLTIQPADEE
tara:strand:+ start:161 stop:349 length:189 start_codon:yes stop_codon:yes gene_type:complete